jgi:hypothetical protein
VEVWHEKQEIPVTRARVSRTGKLSDFTTPISRASGIVQRTLGVGGCGNIFFGNVPVAVRQGQRRDAAATGEEQLGRFTERKGNYFFSALSVQWQVSPRGEKPSTSFYRWP